MRKVIPKNIADEMTKPYIDDAVEKQIKAADVPPRNKLNISFENADRTDDNKEYKSNQEAYEKNHGKLYDMTHNNTIPWKNYVVYIVLLSLLTCVFTFSKYMSSATGDGVVVAATFNYYVDVLFGKDNEKQNVTSGSGVYDYILEDKQTFTDTGSQMFTFKIFNKSDVAVTASASFPNGVTDLYTVVASDGSGVIPAWSGSGDYPSGKITVTVTPKSTTTFDEETDIDVAILVTQVD